MKGIEKITAHIEADAKAEAQAIIDAATARANQIKTDYEQKAKDVYDGLMKSGAEEAENIVSNATRLANMESRQAILGTKQDMVSAAFAKAEEKLAALPADKYTAFLVKLAVESASTGDEEIIFNENDKAKYATEVIKEANAKLVALGKKGELKASEKTASIKGGLKVSKDGIEVNSSLELLLDMVRGSMSSQLAEVLFG